MKKLSIVLLAVLSAMCFVSCGGGADDFGKSTAKKLFKKEAVRQHQLEDAATVPTGYFECNDGDIRYKLRQLAANEIITYSCDVVKKMERVKRTRRVQAGYYYRYWTTESYWANEEVNTYFVKVALTEKGKKLVVEEKEVEPDEDTKDMKKDMEIDYSKYPESSVNVNEFPSQDAAEEYAETEIAEEAEEEHIEADEMQPDVPLRADGGQSDYDKAKAKENTVEVNLKAYELKVVKARNVRKTGDYTASAEILLEYENVTPVGRIIRGVYDGQRILVESVDYTYFEDKGWRVNK